MLNVMTNLARDLQNMGWTLRSGGAEGADLSFERGCTNHEIFRVNAIPSSELVTQIAREHHGGYDRCSPYVRKLFDRNVQILLGADCDMLVDFCVYWHEPDNSIDRKGGTNHSLRICRTFHIPTFNIEIPHERSLLERFIS